MSEVRDPLIKLFGADIHFPDTPPPDDFVDHHHRLHPPPSFLPPPDRCVVTRAETKVGDSSKSYASHGEENVAVAAAPTPIDNVNVVRNVQVDQCVETDTGSQEKVLKRPNKVIPCPRCKSLNTKFCYFNNYNVNQPRHFCKNCQRYWTAGGTIRNVPVGAGKRKNKQLTLQCYQDTTSEGTAQADLIVSSGHLVRPNLSLSVPPSSLEGNDETAKLCMTPLCESMVSMFRQNGIELGSVRASEEPSSPVSSISSTALNELELPYKEAAQVRPSVFYYGSTPSISLPYCANPPWTYPWVSVAGLTQPGEPIQTVAIPVEDAPVICTPGMNFPVIPYWGCMPVFNCSALTVPLAGCSEHLSPLYATDSSCSSSSSPNLGKHLRDMDVSAEEKTEKCLWAPKSKKIESMDSAAKCSMLSSLGLKPGKNEPIIEGGVFKAFRPKPESSKHTNEETAPSLKSIPAALSRSQSFQEST